MGKKIIEPGTRFDRLTVIKEDSQRTKDGRLKYWCKCSCGNPNLVSVVGKNLRNGSTKSCGCLVKENAKKMSQKNLKEKNNINLSNRTFGFLTVLRKISGIGTNSIWLCKCNNCGALKEVQQNNLLNGSTKSCGCLVKENAKKMSTYVGHVDGTCLSLIKSKKLYQTNTSGYRGVSLNKKIGKYQAYISFQGKFYNLGYYKEIKDAIAARKKAEEKFYQNFLQEQEKTNSDKQET